METATHLLRLLRLVSLLRLRRHANRRPLFVPRWRPDAHHLQTHRDAPALGHRRAAADAPILLDILPRPIRSPGKGFAEIQRPGAD